MLNHILSALNDYVLAFDQDKQEYSFVSANIYNLVGYTVDDFKRSPNLWKQITDPRDNAEVVSFFRKLKTSGYGNLNYRIVTSTGKIKWINEKRSLITDEQSGHQVMLSIFKDVYRDEETRYDRDNSLSGYSIMFDHNPSPMWIYEIATLRILRVNEAAVKTYGYTEAEFLTMTLKDLRSDTELDNFEQFLIDRGIGSNYQGLSHSGTWKHMSKSGETIHAQITGDSIVYNNYDCRIIVANNVTENVRWQEEVKMREKFFNSLIDSQTNFLIRINMSGRFTFVNKQFTKVFGYTDDDIIGKHFEITSLPEEYHLCEAAFYKCISHPGQVINLAHKKVALNGALFDTEWEFIAITNENGQVTEIQGIGQDVTEKKEAQKEIIYTKNSLEALINNTDDLIWSIDRKNNYLYMNQAYKNAIYMQSGKIPEKGDDTFKHGVFSDDTLEQWHNYYKRAFSGESYIITYENPIEGTDDRIYSEISFNPIYNAEGEINSIGCFAHNITERIRANKAIIDQNERLRNIASISSHELRRPVATLLGLLHIMDKVNFYNPDNREIMEHLLVVGNEIDDVIRLIVDSTFAGNFTDDQAPRINR